MPATEHYDVHGLLDIQTNTDVPVPEYFAADAGSNDRLLEIVERPQLDPTIPEYARRLASHKYWFEDEALSVRYPSTPLGKQIAVRIEGLNSDVTRLTYTPGFRENADFEGLFEGLLTTKLLDAGVVLIHAGAVVNDRGAIVLASMGRMGKTSTLLNLLREDPSLGFMGDNVVLVDRGGTAYCWPATLGVFPGTAVADEQLPGAKQLRVKAKRFVARSDLVSAALLHRFSIDLVEPIRPEAVAEEIVDEAPIGRLIVLNGGRGVTGHHTLKAPVATVKIATGTDMELDPSDYYLSLYAFSADEEAIHPSVVKERRASLLQEALEELEIEEIFAAEVGGYTEMIGNVQQIR